MKTTEETMTNYFNVLETRNPESVAALFDANGLVICGDRIWRGNREIVTFYDGLLNKILVQGMDFKSKHAVIEDGIAYMVWAGKCPSHEVSLGVGNFIVKDDLIYCLTLFMEGNF
jgi:hypothetical protein